ncbi:hypothetical protein EBZ80_11605 [bacterium]|nr:hypothetical protein [bacterium]
MFKRVTVTVIFSMIGFLLATVALEGPQANASSQASVEFKASSQPDGQLELEFKAVPAKGLKINHDGPWSLELKDHPGLEISTSKLGKVDFKESVPGFSVMAKPKTKAGKVNFKMIVFVCTETKSQCFRDVHQGIVDWVVK